MSANILDQVIAIVSEKLRVEKGKIKAESSFMNDLDADSLDMAELLIKLEETFDIPIPDEEAQKIKTVGDAVKYIHDHTGK